jgi:selenocysteine-specific elongation factor
MWQRLRPLVEVDDRRVPVVSELAAALGVTPPLLEAFLLKFVRQGLLVRVSAKRHFTPAMVGRQAALVRELAASRPHGRFTAADFRDRSGLGRNAVIELLEYFDRTGLTRREGDSRLLIGRDARV